MKRRPYIPQLADSNIFLTDCAYPRSASHTFELGKDNFGFRNELRWEYEFPDSGAIITRQTNPVPQYSLRCFPMARAAREFFYHAQFRPELPKGDEQEYRQLVKTILHRNSHCPARAEERVS